MSKETFATKLTLIWIGGLFFWIIKGFRGRLIDQYKNEYEVKNMWTGYFLTLISIGMFVYFVTIS